MTFAHFLATLIVAAAAYALGRRHGHTKAPHKPWNPLKGLPELPKPQAEVVTAAGVVAEEVHRANARHAAMVKVCGTHAFLDPVSYE